MDQAQTTFGNNSTTISSTNTIKMTREDKTPTWCRKITLNTGNSLIMEAAPSFRAHMCIYLTSLVSTVISASATNTKLRENLAQGWWWTLIRGWIIYNKFVCKRDLQLKPIKLRKLKLLVLNKTPRWIQRRREKLRYLWRVWKILICSSKSWISWFWSL